MSRVNIIGGGLLGICIATSLRKKGVADSVVLHERSDRLLAGWTAIEISGVKSNPGFHGLEMPRASETYDYLKSIGVGEFFERKSNERFISVQNHQMSFASPLKEWPTSLREEIRRLDPKNGISPANTEFFQTELGKALWACGKRFSDSLDKSWHLFYPWFFPSEFTFDSGDEGAVFQNKVRTRDVQPWYLSPRGGLFEALAKKVEQCVLDIGVDIQYNSKQAQEAVNKTNQESDEMNMWTLSSYELLTKCSKKLAEASICSKRAFYCFIYSIDAASLNIWRSQAGRMVTEIIFLEEEVPELNRVSFVENDVTVANEKRWILVECFMEEDKSEDEVSKRLSRYLTHLFKSESLALCGHKLVRHTYTFDSIRYDEALAAVKDYAMNYNLQIPHIFFGPLNMAKAGIIANEFARVMA